jgi:hypothetical protein
MSGDMPYISGRQEGKENASMTVPQRAALYLRVSTARQAEHDGPIPDLKPAI